jgi:hypothetical protein
MGTDPPSQVVNTAKAALNYDNMDEEHRRLLQVSICTFVPVKQVN